MPSVRSPRTDTVALLVKMTTRARVVPHQSSFGGSEVESVARDAFPGSPSVRSAFLIVRFSRMPSWRSAIPGHPQDPLHLGMFEVEKGCQGRKTFPMSAISVFQRPPSPLFTPFLFRSGYSALPKEGVNAK